MTLGEAIERYTSNAEYERTHGNLQGCLEFRQLAEWLKDYKRLLEREYCEDAISREAALEINRWHHGEMPNEVNHKIWEELKALPCAYSKPKTGHCKDCKYFEYDSVVKVDGIPLIVAHEICSRWGDGCKTKEDGYCFMFEPQESEE